MDVPKMGPDAIDAQKMAAPDEISPKTIWATMLPLLAGIVLVVVDKLVVGDGVPDETWLALLGSGPLAGLGAFVARPGRVSTFGSKWG